MSEHTKLSDNVIATYMPGQAEHYCCMSPQPGLRIVRDFNPKPLNPKADTGCPTGLTVRPDKLQVPWACRECGRVEWKDVEVVSYEEAEQNKE